MLLLCTVIFGILSGCLLSVLVGVVGSRRRLGFGWSFLLSVLFTPIVGLVCALISEPLPGGSQRWGCLGVLFAILGMLCLAVFILLLLAGGIAMFA